MIVLMTSFLWMINTTVMIVMMMARVTVMMMMMMMMMVMMTKMTVIIGTSGNCTSAVGADKTEIFVATLELLSKLDFFEIIFKSFPSIDWKYGSADQKVAFCTKLL